MTQAHPPAAGRFVWRDLMTNDIESAVRFYGELFGWTTRRQQMGDQLYTMWGHGGVDFGGVVKLSEEEEVPPHWISYATVESVDAAAARASELGATVAVAPTDIPGTGRFAVLVDPQGAVLSPFTFGGEAPPEPDGPPEAGCVAWHQLLARDAAAAAEFYAEIYGWSHCQTQMADGSTYWLLNRGEKEEAGILEMPPEAQGPANWLIYFAVEDVDRTAQRAVELGGKLWVPPSDIPGIGRFAVLADSAGAGFALYKASSA